MEDNNINEIEDKVLEDTFEDLSEDIIVDTNIEKTKEINSSILSSFKFKETIEYNNFAIRFTQNLPLPSEIYIKSIAKRYGLFYHKIPLLWKDLYTLFKLKEIEGSEFDLSNHIYTKEQICDILSINNLDDQLNTYYESSIKFIKKIDFDNIPGHTPLIQTFNVITYLSYVNNKKEPTNEDLFLSTSDEKIISDSSILDKLDDIDSDNYDDYFNQNMNDFITEYKDDLSYKIRKGLYDLNPMVLNILGSDVDNRIIPMNTAFKMLVEVKSYIEGSLGEALGSATDYENNNNSDIYEYQKMSDIGQVSKTSTIQKSLPQFKEKVVKKELSIKTKIAPNKSKQSAIIAIDDSGSMSTIFKQSFVRGILLHLLENVVKGDMELIFYNYVTHLYNRKEVLNEEDCKQLFSFVSSKMPNGGGTNIGSCIQNLVDEVISKPELINPEIFIICDGEDFVDPDKIDFKDVKVNVITIGVDNKNLQECCNLTKGTYLYEPFPKTLNGQNVDSYMSYDDIKKVDSRNNFYKSQKTLN